MNRFSQWMTALLFVVLVAGCASKKIDWQPRLGNYTYDQAVIELGPPDKSAKLSDGSTIAEWYEHRGSGVSLGVGTGISTGSVGVGVGVPVTGPRVGVLRLTFGPDGVLRSASR